MGSIQVPDFVEVNEDILWNRAANDPDTIANARGFLEETYRK
jgi:hypothetical protein